MTNYDIPFSAAIFDLDGTLLDSTWVWLDVDARFFGARGIDYSPADYAHAVQGMSFREAAEYTVRQFGLRESVDAVMAEWMDMTRETYAHRVALKPGARDYLRALKRAGVKLAVATANREELFMPTLEREGVAALFDAFCTSADVGHRGKGDGALFRLAAERIGVEPPRCVVFEDTLEGVQGARLAGMGACAVRNPVNGHNAEAIAALAEDVIDDFTEMGRFHQLPEARRCAIFTALCEGGVRRAYAPKPGDFVLCADGGWTLARDAGIQADLVMGDFDSSDAPADEPVARYPVEKDDTDTMLCLKRGLALGFDDFIIVGGFGGRVDHTLANFQTLHYAAARHARAVMADGLRWATVVKDGAVRVPADILGRDAGAVKLSVFALDGACRGVTIRGAKWSLEDATWSNAFPLGVSNEFAGDWAEIAVAEGALLVTVCGA